MQNLARRFLLYLSYPEIGGKFGISLTLIIVTSVHNQARRYAYLALITLIHFNYWVNDMHDSKFKTYT